MRLPKFDRAATATILAASVVTIAGALLLAKPWNLETAPANPVATATNGERPVVEIVFALDTTSSMSGLLDSAKKKIWSIANQVVSAQPRPDVRIGLVLFRDKADAYVTERVPLTNDIDAIYERLLSAQAAGGNDFPEHVNKALDVAINETQWRDNGKVLKLIFLVGDAPPHDDYSDTPTSVELARLAASKGIIINTLQAGSQPDTTAAWTRIADAAVGKYAAIAQDGGTVAVATPFDKDLERYNRELADNAVFFGAPEDKARMHMRMDARRKMSGETAAATASVTGAKGGYLGKGDLLSALDEGEVDLDSIPAAEAPEEIRSMSKSEKTAWVAAKKSKRTALSGKVAKLSAKRKAYLKKNKAPKADSFDDNVSDMLKEQAEAVGVTVE